jgi:hypothetical protein
MYGEGEYIHPETADVWNRYACGIKHWRNWIPASYYVTHSIGPIMFITGTMPVKVNGFMIPFADDDPVARRMVRVNDAASAIMLRMDNGATVKLLQYLLRGHGSWVRLHCSRGLMENMRTGRQDMVRAVREQYHEKRTEPVERIYLPNFPTFHQKAITSGHGGSDFSMNMLFANAIRKNEQPSFDVHKGVTMSAVGILAYRSALDNSNTIEIPDFRKDAVLKKYAKDNWSPNPADTNKNQPMPSILGKIKPTKFGLSYARKNWKEVGYLE